MGHGTNVFFSDEGYRGVIAVIKFNKISLQNSTIVTAEAGVSLSDLNKVCIENELTGLEFSSGIPGSVGGAVYGNAGAYGKSISQCLVEAKILTTDNEIKTVNNNYFKFKYRHSALKENNSMFLQGTFQFEKGSKTQIQSRVNEIMEMRRRKLPPQDWLTAGSYFKNLKDKKGNATAAAKFLDMIGSKKISVNDAAIFQGHANIFYNKGNATAKDILQLEEILKERVYNQFGIKLEREVIFIE